MIRMFSLSWFEKLARPSVNLGTGTAINWRSADKFYRTVTGNVTFSFSNVKDGMSITLLVENLSSSTINVTFPSGTYKDGFENKIEAGKVNTYTFIRMGGKTLVSAVVNMSA